MKIDIIHHTKTTRIKHGEHSTPIQPSAETGLSPIQPNAGTNFPLLHSLVLSLRHRAKGRWIKVWSCMGGFLSLLLLGTSQMVSAQSETGDALQKDNSTNEANETASGSDAQDATASDDEDPFADIDWDALDDSSDDSESEDGDEDWDFSDLKFEEDPIYKNSLTVGFQNTWVDGNDAAFQRRFRTPDGPAGGLESLHYEAELKTRSRLAIDSRIMPGLEDYYFQLHLEDPEIGWFKTGFRQLRTWHDASGGYYPPSQSWIVPFSDDLHLDSGEIWFVGGLTLPDKPVFTFGYRHLFRNGSKDSLVWGDSALIAGSATPPVRGIVPSFRDIDDDLHSFRLGAEHTLATTKLDLGLRYDLNETSQSLKTARHPGEPLFDRKSTTTDSVDTDLFNIHASSVTRFSEKLQLGAGYGFTTLDSDVSGSRIFGSQYDALFDPVFNRRRFRDAGFLGLNGGSQLKQSVLNLNLFYRPWENVALIPALRAERTSTESGNGFAATTVDPTFTTRQDNYWLDSERKYQELSERLELRYTGWSDWSLYGRGEWTQGAGDLDEFLMGVNPLARMTDDDRRTQKYTAGANWYPLANLNFGFQYFHKIHNLGYDHELDSTPNQFPSRNQLPAFISDRDFKTDDLNIRMTWRPISKVTMVSRYDYQNSQVDSQAERIGSMQEADLEAHIFSESITWQPWSRLYLQGGFSYTDDVTTTSANSILVSGTPIAPRASNSYWNANGAIGLAATEKVDLDLSYYYYRADNYSDNSTVSLPYGADFKEHVVRWGVQYRVSPQVLWKSSYSFYRTEDMTSGGNNNFDAHGIYTSIQYLF